MEECRLTSSQLGVQSPLMDLFLRGEVPRDVRLLAARGQLAQGVTEQLALLAVTSDDLDIEVAAAAQETLAALPAASVARHLSQADVPAGLRAWCEARGWTGSEPSVHVPSAAPDDGEAAGSGEAQANEDEASTSADASDPLRDSEGSEDALELLSSLPVPARIKMAMLGTREQRAILVRDPNRVVSAAVLSSPKLSDTEVENFARMSNVTVDVLRIIGTNRAWLRNYTVIAALVRNARTPPGISLGLVPRLQERDVKSLAVDRNLPEAVRLAARKMLQVQHSRRG